MRAVSVLSIIAMGSCYYAFGCQNILDCSLNGDCSAGVCKCDPAWTGKACAQLDVAPASTTPALYRATNATWGLSVVQDPNESGVFHGYVAAFAGECGLDSWIHTSLIWHAVALSPTGPFMNETVVEAAGDTSPVFRHNPTAVWHNPSSKIVLTHIGCGNQSTPPQYSNCTGGQTPSDLAGSVRPPRPGTANRCNGFNTNAMAASSPGGPWSEDVNLVAAGGTPWPNSMDNPAPLVLANGTVLSMFRSYNHTHGPTHSVIGIARGQSSEWDGPYSKPSHPILGSGPEGSAPYAQLEDPFFWQDARGYKALFHSMGGCTDVGCFAFSEDSYHWHMTGSEVDGVGHAYSREVLLSNGSSITYKRRERPHLVFVRGVEHPVALTNGVLPEDDGDHSYSIAVPLRA